jgi:hypothetical protein
MCKAPICKVPEEWVEKTELLPGCGANLGWASLLVKCLQGEILLT